MIGHQWPVTLAPSILLAYEILNFHTSLATSKDDIIIVIDPQQP